MYALRTLSCLCALGAVGALAIGCTETTTPVDAGGDDASSDAAPPSDTSPPRDAGQDAARIDAATPCSATQYQGTGGVCTDLTVCSVTQYESTAPTATSDRACTDLTVCDAATQFESTAPTATTDRVCADLTVCDAATQFESTAPTATTDRACSDLTVCDATQFESTAPTATTDRACTLLTVCVPGQLVTTDATATTDRACGPCPGSTYSTTTNASSCDGTICEQPIQGAVAPTGTLADDTCAAGEEASAVAVHSEGRGYVDAIRIGCSTVSSSGTVGAVRWPAGAPPSGYVTYQCPAGEIVSGITVDTGDIVDLVGVLCQTPSWGSDDAATGLGLAATATNTHACPAGNGLVALSSASVNYFGAPVLAEIDTTCAASPTTSSLTRAGGQDAVLTTTAFAALCPAGEVAVGIGVGIEGRNYVQSFVVDCALLDAARTGYGTSHTVGTLTGTPHTASCAAGEQLVGITAETGDILDGLGAICAPIDWTSASTTSVLGPWGTVTAATPSMCPAGQVVTGLSGRTVNYFGGPTASAVVATCAPLACQ